MAKHNEVLLYGYCNEKPQVLIDDTTGDAVRCVFSLITIRGIRDFGQNIDYARLDRVRILTLNKRMIETARKIEPNSMVVLKGSFNTRNVMKTFICKHCGEKVSAKGSIAFINPIFIDIREKVANENEALALLKEKYELSNCVTLIGMLCRSPEIYTTANGTTVSQYQMAVMRKYKLFDENTDNTVDFPWIKSYGKIAMSDYQSLRKGSYVFLDGVVQSREIIRRIVCPKCDNENEWSEVVAEVVPYAVEYLRDNDKTQEITSGMVSAIRKDAEKIESEKYIQRDYNSPDFDVNKFIENEVNKMPVGNP